MFIAPTRMSCDCHSGDSSHLGEGRGGAALFQGAEKMARELTRTGGGSHGGSWDSIFTAVKRKNLRQIRLSVA